MAYQPRQRKERRSPWLAKDEEIAQLKQRVREAEAAHASTEKLQESLTNEIAAMRNTIAEYKQQAEQSDKNYRDVFKMREESLARIRQLETFRDAECNEVAMLRQHIGRLEGFLQCLAQESGKSIRLPSSERY